MRLQQIVIFAVALVFCVCKEGVEVKILETRDNEGNENEIISIDLKRKDEDINLVAQMRIHLVDGKVHLNNNSLDHNVVNHVHTRLLVAIIENGKQNKPELKAARLRVLVTETTGENGQVLTFEEEFVQIGGHEVFQVDVQQIIFESMVRKPVIKVTLEASTIHAMPVKKDRHVTFTDSHFKPHHPDHGDRDDDDYTMENVNPCYYDDENEPQRIDDGGVDPESDDEGHHDEHHHHEHHHEHHHGHKKHHGHRLRVKCWYHSLSWKSKFALFSIGFMSLITFVLLCSLCARRRQARRQRLNVNAPIDDTVAVDMDDVKKVDKKDEVHDFHFEFDNAPIVVSDKQELMQ